MHLHNFVHVYTSKKSQGNYPNYKLKACTTGAQISISEPHNTPLDIKSAAGLEIESRSFKPRMSYSNTKLTFLLYCYLLSMRLIFQYMVKFTSIDQNNIIIKWK